ncbi:MAG: phosphate ABC transporter permease subunit PstC [Pirellulaceae bacterium]|nr:phosphate ABC transporter permease subunit PstC [Pirellulaceae bacterium]
MATITIDPINPSQSYPPRSLTALYVREWIVKVMLASCGLLSLLVTGSIIFVLVKESMVFFSMPGISVTDFLTSTEWTPTLGNEVHYGIWALISGTILVSFVAMLIALPIGLITAIYLSEYAHRRVRAILKPVLEVLAGIPTVVYGFFALTVITPSLKFVHPGFNIYNGMSAGIAVGILCLPIVTSMAEDALRAVPRSLREGAFGLGCTKLEVTLKVVLPAALSGIISAFLLAISRAVGETMIVALASGSQPHLTLDPREATQTMTGWMIQMGSGDTSQFDARYYSMYAVACILFILTFALTMVGNWVRRRFREAYE